MGVANSAAGRPPVLFNSQSFLFLFLPVVLLGWWLLALLPSASWRLAFLTLASYVFYVNSGHQEAYWWLLLLLGSTTVDYIAGHVIKGTDDAGKRKLALVAALSFNLTVLGIFKYLGFFEGLVGGLAGLFGAPDAVPIHHIALPIGISFYTFNSMSYTIDVYRRRVEPAQNILEYSTFVALFPHLIAGPIVRYSDIDSQFRSLQKRFTSRMAAIGIFFFVVGVFKKEGIADTISPHVDRLYAHADQLGVVAGWAAALGYSMQLYFDFSGYSDMAVGLAMLLGFRFPQNFDSPYKAVNISDFWRRWHMSLSRWLRDYLYIALGGSRRGRILTLRNLFITMFLGGLWHGAAGVFVLWGIGHGLLLVVHNVASDRGWVPPTAWMSRAITFVCVVLLWVPFRAGLAGADGAPNPDSLSLAGDMLASMFGANGLGLAQVTSGVAEGASVSLATLAFVGVLLLFVNVAPNTWEYRFRPSRRLAFGMAAMATVSILLLATPSPFLYFQF